MQTVQNSPASVGRVTTGQALLQRSETRSQNGCQDLNRDGSCYRCSACRRLSHLVRISTPWEVPTTLGAPPRRGQRVREKSGRRHSDSATFSLQWMQGCLYVQIGRSTSFELPNVTLVSEHAMCRTLLLWVQKTKALAA
jgi:hypothetical protein